MRVDVSDRLTRGGRCKVVGPSDAAPCTTIAMRTFPEVILHVCADKQGNHCLKLETCGAGASGTNLASFNSS